MSPFDVAGILRNPVWQVNEKVLCVRLTFIDGLTWHGHAEAHGEIVGDTRGRCRGGEVEKAEVGEAGTCPTDCPC